jgi:hypothetical protein
MKEWLEIVPSVAVAFTALTGLLAYLRSKRVERTKILLDLHKHFVDSEKYSDIRAKIESSNRLLGIIRSPSLCLPRDAAKCHLNDAICFLRKLYPVPIGASLP